MDRTPDDVAAAAARLASDLGRPYRQAVVGLEEEATTVEPAAVVDVAAAVATARAHLAAIDPDDIERDDHGRFASHGGGGDTESGLREAKAEVPGQGGFDFDAVPEEEPAPIDGLEFDADGNYVGGGSDATSEDWLAGASTGPAPGTVHPSECIKAPGGKTPIATGARDALSAVGTIHGLPPGTRPVEIVANNAKSYAGGYATRSYTRDTADGHLRGEIVDHGIKISRASDINQAAAAFVATHEIGHYIAQCAMGKNDRYDASERYGGRPPVRAGGERSYPEATPEHWRGFFDSIDRTGAQERRESTSLSIVKSNASYFRDNAEVWARAYSQYVATKDPAVGAAFDRARDSGHFTADHEAGVAWTPEEMTVVGPAVEAVLRGEGLMV